MRIVEAHILAARQGYDQLLLRNGNGPGHGASAIAMLHPTQRIGLIAAFEPLHLALAQMQQAGGFAYAQPPARCIFNHLHSLELFFAHRHHPCRVTESRCSYGVTLSWSIYSAESCILSAPPPAWCTLSVLDPAAHPPEPRLPRRLSCAYVSHSQCSPCSALSR